MDHTLRLGSDILTRVLLPAVLSKNTSEQTGVERSVPKRSGYTRTKARNERDSSLPLLCDAFLFRITRHAKRTFALSDAGCSNTLHHANRPSNAGFTRGCGGISCLLDRLLLCSGRSACARLPRRPARSVSGSSAGVMAVAHLESGIIRHSRRLAVCLVGLLRQWRSRLYAVLPNSHAIGARLSDMAVNIGGVRTFFACVLPSAPFHLGRPAAAASGHVRL